MEIIDELEPQRRNVVRQHRLSQLLRQHGYQYHYPYADGLAGTPLLLRRRRNCGRFQLLRPQPSRNALNQRQAAVLVPIVRRPQPGLLLTQRSPLMRKHAGQVAFPGGAVDNTDATLIAAALREAQEEVAIPPSRLR
jgi:hypothetical protein